MKWIMLLPIEARVALRRPTTLVAAGILFLAGIALGFVFSQASTAEVGSFVTTMTKSFGGGAAQVVVFVAILIGAGIGAEDHDLGTRRDLWLAGIGPIAYGAAKLVVAIETVLLSTLVLLLGGAVTGAVNVFFRGAPLYADSMAGAAGPLTAVRAGLIVLVVTVPVVVTVVACIASVLRSRLYGVVAGLGIYVLYLAGFFLAAWNSSLGILAKVTPIGSSLELVRGLATPGRMGFSMRPWTALLVTVGWVVVLLCAVWWREHTYETRQEAGCGSRAVCGGRFGFSGGRGVSSRRHPRIRSMLTLQEIPRRTVRARTHLVVAWCLMVVLGVCGVVAAGPLVAAGAKADVVYQALTNDLRSDYMERLAILLNAGDLEQAQSYVGPSGLAGFRLIEQRVTAGETHVTHSQGGDGVRTFGILRIEPVTEDEGDMPGPIAEFALDLHFEKGSWHCAGIKLW